MSAPTKKTRKSSWKQDPESVKSNILAVATEVFANNGLSGARIDEIVRRTNTSKRMIYYYFGDKNRLYQSVLQNAYAQVRAGEAQLDLDSLEPVTALTRLVEFTFDYHRDNPTYVRLVQIENIHQAANLARSGTISDLNQPAVSKLEHLYRKGVAARVFVPGLKPVELHWLITSTCFFNVSNRATFEHLYGKNLFSTRGQNKLKALAVASVLGVVLCK